VNENFGGGFEPSSPPPLFQHGIPNETYRKRFHIFPKILF